MWFVTIVYDRIGCCCDGDGDASIGIGRSCGLRSLLNRSNCTTTGHPLHHHCAPPTTLLESCAAPRRKH
eukprot:scaffold2236_cov152-Skeletonema_menzelii.AAC.24